jgi:RNA polymerase sigma factor (sigma-70 family)
LVTKQIAALLRHVSGAFRGQTAESSDADLLEKFARHGDEPAFAALVQRHGPLVWKVSRRTARHEQDAEDVYQATFLVLARKASTIRKGGSLGSWLYGVAYRLGLRARSDAARRRQQEQGAARPTTTVDDLTWRELREVLDQELARLPDKFRAPLELCYFDELTHEEAARQLGWSARSVRDRLERGRRRLRLRLTKRGLTLSLALANAVLGSAHASAAPPAITAALIQAAGPYALRRSLAGTISATALALAEGGLQTMFSGKLYVMAMGLIALLVFGGAGLFGGRKAEEAAPAIAAAPEEGDRRLVDRLGDPLPAGAVARLGTVRFRFSPVGCAFLPDGKTVVSVGQNGGIDLWDARTGRLLREIDTGRFSRGWGVVSLSGDGKRLAVSGVVAPEANAGWRRAARVYDLASGEVLRAMEGEALDGINTVVLRPQGKLLFTLDGKGTLQALELATGAEVARQVFPGDSFAALAVSPDGSTLAVASGPNSRKLFLWNWQSSVAPRPLDSGDHRGRHLAFSPDGKLMAECSDSQADIRLFDVATGTVLRKLELPDTEPYRHLCVAFAPNGKLLAASGRTNHRTAVHLWSPVTGKFLERLDINEGQMSEGDLAFSPDSSLLVVGSRVWDFAAGKELSANAEAPRGWVERIVTGARDLVVTAAGDNTVRIWDAASGKQLHRLVHKGTVRGIALAPDTSRLVSISAEDGVFLWDVATGKQIYRLLGHGQMGSLAQAAEFTPDSRSFFTWSGSDMNLRKWDVRTGKAVLEHHIQPTGVALPSEDDGARARERKLLFIGGEALTADAKKLVFELNRRVFVFDTTTGKELSSFPSDASERRIAPSPDGRFLLTSDYAADAKGQVITWWDLTTGKQQKKAMLTAEEPGPVAFSPDGKFVAAASGPPGACIHVLAAATGREVKKISGFRGIVRSLAFLPDGQRLVSGMEDSSALVWDLTRVP